MPPTNLQYCYILKFECITILLYFFYNDKLIDQVNVFTEEELRSATDVYTGRIERKDSLVSDGKFDSIINSLNMLAVEIEKDFKEENSMTNFAKERMKSKDSTKPT